MCDYFALQDISKVYSGLGGVEIPTKLYINADPSGKGKKSYPRCESSLICGTSAFFVIVNGL